MADSHKSKLVAEIVCRRRFNIINGKKEWVRLNVTKPFKGPSKTSWFCQYEIIGPDVAHTGFAAGVDSLQAMQNALANAGATIRYLNEKRFNRKLRWLSVEDPVLGMDAWLTAVEGKKGEFE